MGQISNLPSVFIWSRQVGNLPHVPATIETITFRQSMPKLGRTLQGLGLTILPLALLLNLLPAPHGGKPLLSGIGQMLLVVACGLIVFWIGRLLEAHAK